MKHSRIPPSSAHIWGRPGGCRGWVAMLDSEGLLKDTETDACKEGLEAHAWASAILAGMKIGGPTDDPEMDLEMEKAVRVYTNDVAQTLDSDLSQLHIEALVSATRVHPQYSVGTTDSYAYLAHRRTLYVWDYKHGRQNVEAFENWQCINYAVGILDTLGLPDLETTVEIRIVQPRAYHPEGAVKVWSLPAHELRPYANHLARGAEESLSGTGKIHTGTHCRYCRARVICPAALEAGVELYEAVAEASPDTLEVKNLAHLYSITKRAKEHLTYMLEGYTAQMEHHLRSGESVPGYTLEPTRGNRKWRLPPEETQGFLEALGVDPIERKLMSPAKVEAILGSPELIGTLTERPTTGLKIKQIDINLARRIFKS